MISTSHDLVRKGSAEELIGHHDRALEYYRLGLNWIAEAFKAHKLAAPGAYFPNCLSDRYALNHGGSTDDKMKAITKELDCDVWLHLLGATDLQSLMDAETKKAFEEQCRTAPAPVTVDNLISTLTDLRDRRGPILQQSLVNVFKQLSRHYANNDAYRLGRKLVLNYALSRHCGFYSPKRDYVCDLDRMFHVLDGKPAPSHLNDAGHVVHDASWAHKATCETEYFTFSLFKNGNLHVRFRRPDLVAKANKIVADYYGAVLADARRT